MPILPGWMGQMNRRRVLELEKRKADRHAKAVAQRRKRKRGGKH